MAPLPTLRHDYVLVNPSPDKLSNQPIAEFILENIKQFGNGKAMVDSMTEGVFTCNDVIRDTIKVAAGLKAKGVKPGDVIGICSENCLEYGSLVLGILANGATCLPLNPIYNIEELQHILSIAQPSKIFVSPLFVDKIRESQSRMPFINEIIVVGDATSNSDLTSYKQLINNSETLETFKFAKINTDECVAFLLCSSGTTGLPKCVELTHKNFMCFMNFVGNIWDKDVPNLEKVTMGLIPFFHGYGIVILLMSLITKTLIVVMARFEEQNFLSSIQKYKITHLFLVPPLVVFLSKHPLVSKYDMSSIRKILSGAAPLSRETQMQARKRLKLDFDIQQGYGMTELSICCVAFQTDQKKIGASGTIAPGMECKVVDLETGKALPPYGKGELCFKGPFVMKGYKNNPKATRETFDSDGWFHTGDIAYYDNDGYLFIVDRLKELIKYKGFQVAPAELETLLLNHPQIKDAGVIGIPDDTAGELPLAFVVKQPNTKITENDIKNYIAGKVSPQKRLRGGVKFIDEIPKNPSGKILRRQLRAMVNKSKL